MSHEMNAKLSRTPQLKLGSDGDELVVDERLMRKVLSINPHLRRETMKIERDETRPSQDDAARVRAAIDLFATSKMQELVRLRESIALRRAALDEEEHAGTERLRQQVIDYLSLINQEALQRHGNKALAEHASFFENLGLRAQDLITSSKR